MKEACLEITKYVGSFIGDKGDQVKYQYVDIEFAPNCYSRFKLNENNLRTLQKYAPNMYQLLMNIPEGQPVVFKEYHEPRQNVGEIYTFSKAENEL